MSDYEEPGRAVADASGNAIVLFACPGPPVRRLTISSIAILSTSTLLPIVTVYDGSVPVSGRVRASSRIGDRNTVLGDSDFLMAGQSINVYWTGCTPGAVCTAVLRGTTT